jgi:hypothetical protein
MIKRIERVLLWVLAATVGWLGYREATRPVLPVLPALWRMTHYEGATPVYTGAPHELPAHYGPHPWTRIQ